VSPIVLSEIGGPSGPQGPFSPRVFAGQALGRLPPTALLLLALSGLAAGLLAALIVKLPLIVLGAISILAGLLVAVLL
jgi:hypothetical protein